MLKRRCNTCRRTKPITSFYNRGDGRRRIACKPCYIKNLKPRDKEKVAANSKSWYVANKDRVLSDRKLKYATSHPIRKKVLKQSKDYYYKHKAAVGIRTKRYRHKLKTGVIQAYGGCCSCCGEKESDFLTVEHVNGDGKTHRASVASVYRDLRNKGYPRGDYTVLCFNCNIAKSLFGTCPHQRKGGTNGASQVG